MADGTGELHVVFGTGPLGLSVMRALLRRGKRVRMVNSRGSASVPAEVEVRPCDLYRTEQVTELTRGAAGAYQCAQPPYHQWPQRFPSLQAAILDGVAKNGARLVLAENLYMYGRVSGRIHEGLPYNAPTRKGRVRARMAEAALEAHRSGKIRVSIGRGSDFFGPHVLESALGERAIVQAMQGKAAQLVGRTDLPHTYTFIEDFGEALAVLGERDEALGRAWHVPNDRPEVTQSEMMNLLFAEIGRPPRVQSIGRPLMSLVGLFVPGARETVEMMYEFEEPFVVDSSAYETTFHARATPLREAVRRTVAWYREHLRMK